MKIIYINFMRLKHALAPFFWMWGVRFGNALHNSYPNSQLLTIQHFENAGLRLILKGMNILQFSPVYSLIGLSQLNFQYSEYLQLLLSWKSPIVNIHHHGFVSLATIFFVHVHHSNCIRIMILHSIIAYCSISACRIPAFRQHDAPMLRTSFQMKKEETGREI